MSEDEAIKTIARFNSDYYHKNSDVLLVKKLKDKGLSVIQIAAVIETLESICKECFDDERPCACSWDE